MLDALWASSHSPTGKARGTLPFGLLDASQRRAEVSGAGCRMTESDGEATRGSSGLLGGAFFVFLFIAPPTRRWRSSSPLSGA